MKLNLIIFVFIFLYSLPALSKEEYSDLKMFQIPDLEEKNQHFLNESILQQIKQRKKALMKKLRALPWGPNEYLIKHTDFTASIDPATGMLDAQGKIEITIITDKAKNILFYTEVDTLSVSDSIGELEFKQKKQYGVQTVTVQLRDEMPAGSQMSLKFITHGTPVCTEQGSLNVLVCIVGSANEINLGGFELMLPNGIYGDFGTIAGKVNVPVGYVLVTTGITEDVSDFGNNIITYKINQSFPSQLHAWVLAKYVNFSDIFSTSQSVSAFFPDKEELKNKSNDILNLMKNSIDYYAGLFGDFLYPKLDSVYIPNDTGASFGYPAMVMIVEEVYKGQVWHMAGTFSHEISHQWFGNILKPNWYSSGAWMSEGFAEFSSEMFIAEKIWGNDKTKEEIEKQKQNAFRSYHLMYEYFIPPDYDIPMAEMDGSSAVDPMVYMIITYYKGACVVNMLRNLLGDEQFYKAMKILYEIYAGKNFYYTEKQLRQILETAYGDKLDWFFNQWINGKGYVIYKAGIKSEKKSESSYKVTLSVRNENSIMTDPFKMPVDLTIVTENQEITHTELIDQIDNTFTYEVSERPVRVKVDPDFKIIKRALSKLDGDLNISGEVDGVDLLYTAWSYGSLVYDWKNSKNFISSADFNWDGAINDDDLNMVIDNFGKVFED